MNPVLAKWIVLLPLFWANFVLASEIFQDSLPSGSPRREMVYLHIDRYAYYSGETIWFKGYLVDSQTHQPDTESKVVYVDLLNAAQTPVCSRIIKMDWGGGAGDITIPTGLITGEYTLRAYTRYMANFDPAWFFYRKVYITTSQLDAIANRSNDTQPAVSAEMEVATPQTALQFFPEGGAMVNDFISRVAFKATNENGQGIEVNGSIVDQSGNELMSFHTRKFGLGSLNFAPHKGESYKARYEFNGHKYECSFPTPLDSGAVMQVIERSDHYTILVRSSLAHGTKNFSLTGRQRNKLVASSKIDRAGEGAKIDISKKLLETGVVQFTLFNQNGLPVCERLAYVEGKQLAPPVRIDSLKETYRLNEHINLLVSSSVLPKTDSAASMSVSVVNTMALKNPDDDLTIQSYLLLKSELKGEIEHPSYYLSSPDPNRKNMLDLLLLTQGWRQFIISDTPNSPDLKYQPEKGLCFRGHVRRFAEDGKPAKAKVSLFYSNKQEDVYYETTTDETGYFAFEGLDFTDTTKVIIQAKKAGTGDSVTDPHKYFVIVMDSLNVPSVRNGQPNGLIQERKQELTGKSTLNEPETAFQLQKGDILIDEVLVVEKKKDPRQEKRSMYFEPSFSVSFDEIRKYEGSSNLIDVLTQRTPSRILSERLSMNKDSGPMFLLNGMPVSKESALSIPTSEIDFVDILEGPKTVIYGSGGSNGVIAIYTLNGSNTSGKLNGNAEKCVLKRMHPGFAGTRKFYQPIYPLTISDPEKQAEPFTIYWNPGINPASLNRISFRAPHLPGTYRLTLEGITSSGQIIHSEANLDVR